MTRQPLLTSLIIIPLLVDQDTYMQGKNKITQYSNTSESLAPNGIKVTLHGRDLWSKFHKSTTEMIITKAGRSVITRHI